MTTYNRVAEFMTLKFLRVRIGQTFTPDELFSEISRLCEVTKEDFEILLKILTVEELIEVSSNVTDQGFQVQKIVSITKGGLELLRGKKQ